MASLSCLSSFSVRYEEKKGIYFKEKVILPFLFYQIDQADNLSYFSGLWLGKNIRLLLDAVTGQDHTVRAWHVDSRYTIGLQKNKNTGEREA